jgi:hypothetical protein
MLRRLSEYRLGICMPHMHDEITGEFQPLPDDIIQVESGLDVSFCPIAEIATQTDRFLPTGWYWRAGAASTLAVCEMIREEGAGDTEHYGKHKTKPKETSAVLHLSGHFHGAGKDKRQSVRIGNKTC